MKEITISDLCNLFNLLVEWGAKYGISRDEAEKIVVENILDCASTELENKSSYIRVIGKLIDIVYGK